LLPRDQTLSRQYIEGSDEHEQPEYTTSPAGCEGQKQNESKKSNGPEQTLKRSRFDKGPHRQNDAESRLRWIAKSMIDDGSTSDVIELGYGL